MTTVAVAVPSIPPRAPQLARALTSVAFQSRPADEISVAIDHHHDGAAITRNRAWRNTTADHIAFLDDDDEYEPDFIEVMLATLLDHDADLVYPHFTVVGGADPFPQFLDLPWDPADPRQTTVCCLWRREALEKIDGFPEPADGLDTFGHRAGEEFLAVCALNDAGGRIVNAHRKLFRWHHWGGGSPGMPGNTSGLGSRW